MAKNLKLEKLEDKQKSLKIELMEIDMEIRKLLDPLPQIFINSWDGMGLYEEGHYTIDAPLRKVEVIRVIVSSGGKNIVTLKSGEEIALEDYFIEDEVASLRLM